MTAALYDLSRVCPACGAGHIAGPCSAPCVCKCRKCGERLDCRGEREDWRKPLSEAEARRRGMVLTSYGYVPPKRAEAER